MQALSAACPCLSEAFSGWAQDSARRQERAMMQAGCTCNRKSNFLGGFGSRSESVTLRLSSQSDTVLQWRKAELEGDESWTDVDVTDVSIVDKRGDAGLALVSRRGDLLLDVEMADGEAADVWVVALTELVEDLKRNPQRAEAAKGVAVRAKEAAAKQAHFAQRALELRASKRDAEARKAKYIEEAGGLKYTAMAMANRN